MKAKDISQTCTFLRGYASFKPGPNVDEIALTLKANNKWISSF